MTPAADFEPIRNQNMSEAVAARIRTEILHGTYAPGSRLPSERELALAFGVNRVTVREALVKLQGLGLVSVRQGSGVEVLDYRDSGKIDLLLHLLTEPDSEGRYDARVLLSAIEVSRTLHLLAVELAFPRMKPGEAGRLLEILDRQETLADDPEAFLQNSAAFHRALFEAAHSIALRLISNTFREVFEAKSSPFRRARAAELRSGYRTVLLDWSRTARKYVEKRDVARMKKHMESLYEAGNRRFFLDVMEKMTFQAR